MKQHHRLGAIALVLVPLAGLLVGIGMSPAVHVGGITVEAPTASLGEEVKRQLEVPAGASMLFYPLNRVTEQVQRCYRVKEVSVERTSPHELLVKVTAWPAFAALGNSSQWPGHCALLVGPARSGKTLMARYFAAQGGKVLDDAVAVAVDAVEMIVRHGVEHAMQHINGR